MTAGAALEAGIDRLTPDDRPAVGGSDAEGIATGEATSETAVAPWPAWDRADLGGHRLVARLGGVRRGVVLLERRSEEVGRW